jgi:hypothetical protein
VQANLVNRESTASALVRPAHELQGRLDMSPGLGPFVFALHFEVNGLLGGFDHCVGTVCFQQLPRVVVDFDFSHGVMLLLFSPRP